MRPLLPLLLITVVALALGCCRDQKPLTAPGAGDGAGKRHLEIPAKIDPAFRPEVGDEYTLGWHSLYRTSQPGPAAVDTSIAWSLANEFVHRTALAKDYILPATSTGPLDEGWYSVNFAGKLGARQS